MDPHDGELEEHGEESASRRAQPRDPLAPDFGQPAQAPARMARVVSGEYLVTVNPVDGSEIELCPPGARPERPVKLTPAERAAAAPLPERPAAPLLQREEERERLGRLLAQGRSVRLTGAPGSGRSSLLDQVAEDCAQLAPDGVVRLGGRQRGAQDLWYDLFAAVYGGAGHRPDRGPLLELLQDIGAVVVLDDLELGGAALDELLAAAPECAFLLAAGPEIPAPSATSGVEEVVLGGLDRAGGLELLESRIGRRLTEEEATWAGDLWFESEGLPLRFVQAAALLRQRDRLLAGPAETDAQGNPLPPEVDAYGVPLPPEDAVFAAPVPMPSLAEGAAPVALLASRLSDSARETLRIAVVLGGEVPHPSHLPALVGDTHADAAMAELTEAALVLVTGGSHRLAPGVLGQLVAAGYTGTAEEAAARAHTAAQYYAWWSGHPSVDPARVAAESAALLAALAAVVPAPGSAPRTEEGAQHVSVALARTAAPALAAALEWGAWERLLRSGQEAARLTGEVAEDAYFHHELGVLALCTGHPDRARTELEASIGLRGALSDKRGTVAGRRALALVADRTGSLPPVLQLPPDDRTVALQVPRRGEPKATPATPAFGLPRPAEPDETPLEPITLVARDSGSASASAAARSGTEDDGRRRGGFLGGARRNLVGAGAGVLLVAVLGTVVALGTLSDGEDTPGKVSTNPSATEQPGEPSFPEDTELTESPSAPVEEPPTSQSPTPSESTSPTPSETQSQSPTPSETRTSEPPTTSAPPSTSNPPTTSAPPTTKPPTTKPPTTDPETTPPTTTPGEPGTSDSASGPTTPQASASLPTRTAPGDGETQPTTEAAGAGSGSESETLA
ncbi:ATP-binding protein [Streptomyces sp. NA04227]|uniref:ATP-binding protein n=1 Tax=Streptomyces sp. NA04227 TaxID=2742136 RepID=UPI001590E656|nr:ATP-binding protein [Streptomyces sp. NA04227]QKW09198.1 ATP-binding protein [Streptomyces sp. NA04227]